MLSYVVRLLSEPMNDEPTEGCVATYKRTDKTTAPVCTRGDNIELYQWAFDLIPKLSSILIVTINMYLTWLSLYQQEQQTKKFSMGSVAIHKRASNLANDQQRPAVEPSDSPGASRKRFRWSSAQSRRPSQIVAVKLSVAQRLARQSYFYVGALYLTYLPVIVARVYEGATGFVHWEMLYTISFMVPFQGFWNGTRMTSPQSFAFAAARMVDSVSSLLSQLLFIFDHGICNFEKTKPSDGEGKSSDYPPLLRKDTQDLWALEIVTPKIALLRGKARQFYKPLAKPFAMGPLTTKRSSCTWTPWKSPATNLNEAIAADSVRTETCDNHRLCDLLLPRRR